MGNVYLSLATTICLVIPTSLISYSRVCAMKRPWISGTEEGVGKWQMNRCVLLYVDVSGNCQIQVMYATELEQKLDHSGILEKPYNCVVYDAIRPLETTSKCRAMLISS